MQGAKAQIAALTAHGNWALKRGLAHESDEFQEQNSTFKFCESVKFMEGPSGSVRQTGAIYAANPRDWFERLKTEGVCGLWMCYGPSGEQRVPDRKLVGLVEGGGKWPTETRGLSSSDFWAPRWQLGNRERMNRRICRVSYVLVLSRMPSTQAPPEDLEQPQFELKQCLEKTAQLSRSLNFERFTEAFESGIARLESPDPLADVDYIDIVPAGCLSLGATNCWVLRKLRGFLAAWVPGMFWLLRGRPRFVMITIRTISTNILNGSIVAAANSSIP